VNFKDHFSERAALYAAYRPLYPDALFDFVAGLTANHELALDCATGNGQAAVGLAPRFERVIAIDASADQISNATPHPRIDYGVAAAESSGLPSRSVNLVTAAQALHWLDTTKFFAEARRVLAGDGAIAVWGYGDPILDTETLHGTLQALNRGVLEAYWAPERAILLDGYRGIVFPFREVEPPLFDLQMHWTLPELAGYLRTWSATARYIKQHGVDPVATVEQQLAAHWGEAGTTRLIRWPLYIRAGTL
jgi:ubiquinone/menaquinone biosynthesis C-methylase UbiE